jgi:hypothetical protein
MGKLYHWSSCKTMQIKRFSRNGMFLFDKKEKIKRSGND